MAAVLAADVELGDLFAFNQTVATMRGSQHILWVVELDGYESHGSRSAFAGDRHRDYELMLSGYVVLRLANDEIAQDCEKALEKIRDLVRLRRQTMMEGGLR
jgi:very-short-patch-repair endonuclease